MRRELEREINHESLVLIIGKKKKTRGVGASQHRPCVCAQGVRNGQVEACANDVVLCWCNGGNDSSRERGSPFHITINYYVYAQI